MIEVGITFTTLIGDGIIGVIPDGIIIGDGIIGVIPDGIIIGDGIRLTI
jgi:hypothetical protein